MLAALLVATLLSAIGTSFVREARTVSTGTRTQMDVADARALADAGARYAVLRLARADTLSAAGAVPGIWRFGGGTIRLTVTPENGKINLNDAPPDTLAALFEEAGLTPRRALALADAVLAYRRSDGASAREEDGGRPARADRLVLRMSWEMDGKVFDSADELRRVPGVTPELYAALEPAITVYGATRDQETGLYKAAFRIRAEAVSASGARFVRHALIEMTSRRDYAIREWR
ncbi:MAG: hypothetical protein ACFB6R_06795 [Alphaproteobacteria bacterium]